MGIRQKLIDAVGREIIGPAPHPVYSGEDGEELILSRIHGTPKSRYGVAMLYPQLTINEGEVDDNNAAAAEPLFAEGNEELKGSRITDITGSEDDEEPVSLANQFLPSAMGFTLRFRKMQAQNIVILKTSAAAYEREKGYRPVMKVAVETAGLLPVTKANGEVIESEFWKRKSFAIDPVTIDLATITNEKIVKDITLIKGDKGDWLKLKIFNRTTPADDSEGFLTLTFVLVNCMRSVTDGSRNDKYILYQVKLRLETTDENLIAPYSERVAATDTVEEDQLKLLYRKKRVYAIGHGTAVNWKLRNFGVESVETSAVPVYEMPQVAPAGNVVLSMYELSSEGNWREAASMLNDLLSAYEKWIDGIEKEKENLESQYQDAAAMSVAKCRECYHRIKRGVETLLAAEENSDLVRCFRWMNAAMLWQQQRSKTKQRLWKKNGTGKTAFYELEGIAGGQGKEFQSLKDYHDASPYNGKWRPFQLAFILLNIHAIADPYGSERGIVDLIWFPTGGGKTEAYLGLSAFTIFMRRIKGFKDFDWSPHNGTAILMRYTLRLLTTQQYERAASLICACDLIRKVNVELGSDPISIGLWVGGSSTPNTHSSGEGNAVTQYNQLVQKDNAPYNFIVMKCPCCGAQIGKVDKSTLKGLSKNDGPNGHVVFKCENKYCEYGGLELPLFVVDEYIYLKHPTLILGTVDKFAMIPWKKEAGSIFGFREHEGAWTRISPPELIIQDELHLISGPLGTMVGLYEVMVQNLCINYGVRQSPFLPDDRSAGFGAKVIASSATISRAAEQVRSLYGTDQLSIFPPQGLEFGNTWFSEEKEISDQFPARTYVGILGSGYPSIQASIIRSYAAVLQKVKELSDQEKIDYYWTLLGYFNSIRELGNASSLVYADVRERLSQLQNRELVPFTSRRKLFKSEELTSRISAFEIPEALKKLEKSFSNNHNQAIDICLATNMVATGVDISRLGLMFVHGQPKTTAEYIQASSRVGRDVPKGPGLIFTIYSPSKPRDKSLYENFQGYHMRIYAHVEPTSVTPYSINARQKGLHAVFIGLMRHLAEGNLRTNASTQGTDFQQLAVKVKDLIVERCAISDPHELANTKKKIDEIIHFWKGRFQNYGDAGNFKILSDEDYVPLMYASSAEVRDEIRKSSLSTPTSMRGVDSESRIVIVDQKL